MNRSPELDMLLGFAAIEDTRDLCKDEESIALYNRRLAEYSIEDCPHCWIGGAKKARVQPVQDERDRLQCVACGSTFSIRP